MDNHEKKKAKVIQQAIEYQQEEDLSYAEVAAYQEYFRKQGKRYGLLKEFRENGII